MNDTVIVFDRVREFLDGKVKGNFGEIVNQSINSPCQEQSILH
jgi:SecD/SecF fusion protein